MFLSLLIVGLGGALGYHTARSNAAVKWFRRATRAQAEHEANVLRIKEQFRRACERNEQRRADEQAEIDKLMESL